MIVRKRVLSQNKRLSSLLSSKVSPKNCFNKNILLYKGWSWFLEKLQRWNGKVKRPLMRCGLKVEGKMYLKDE